ncbi:hypothetical protein B0J13DRAFT_434754 [Dactylonectria estremocensis]|uniref:DUF7924 domain-containing protein n=1 Tax=Dactylonectria estremocensis TaxID=1079267 RepID=A0A9P9J9V5_9HYPO|nr:hypothetical protein B0J13DRAFT_434754 [Dactylonectria estremocensis]
MQRTAPYVDARYEWILAAKDVFMRPCMKGISDQSIRLIHHLRHNPYVKPCGQRYAELIFKEASLFDESIQMGKNKPVVDQDPDRPWILLPTVKRLAADDKRLWALIESYNEPWTSCIPLAGLFPQPAYAVGFKQDVFTSEELARLSALFGDPVTGQPSIVLASHNMFFSFLTCEVRTTDPWLNMADRQNVHSAAISIGGIVELFRAAGRAHEIDREILAFSVSHDQTVMRIYGHYPVITDEKTAYHRYPIYAFTISPQCTKNRWSAYQFTMNMYDTWMPHHLAKLRRAINQLPLPPNADAAYADASYATTPQAVVSHAALPRAVVSPVRQLVSQDLTTRFDFCFSGLTGRLQEFQGFLGFQGLQ